jgi:hypothetical protein
LISSFDINVKGLFAVYSLLPAVVSGNEADMPVFGEVFYEVESVSMKVFIHPRIKLRGVFPVKFVTPKLIS